MTDQNDSDAVAERIADSVREQMSDGNSRRGFLSQSALAGSALLAIGGGAGLALADEHEGDDETPPMSSFDDVEGTDVDVLNYALSLEQFESAFYGAAMEMFDETAFVEAESLADYSEEQRQMVYGQIETIADHEAQHVQVLTEVVQLLGGEPAAAGEYEFEMASVEEFVSLGQAIENLGVSAYAGAAPYVESPDLLSAALSIHSVEARHAAILNTLSGESPFPAAFDAASAQADVLDTVSQFTPTETPTETPTGGGGNETATPGNETETPMGNGTATPDGEQ